MKILITGGNHAKAIRLLKAFPDHFVLLADYGEVPSIATEKYAFANVGRLNKDSIAHILLNFCITESVNCIIPLNDFEVEPIAKSSVLFAEYGIQVLLPDANQIERYIYTEKLNHQEFAVFINGECIFSTDQSLLQKQYPGLNGVFGVNDGDFKLFTI